MPGKNPLRFPVIDMEINVGDWATIEIEGRAVTGVVKTASIRTRKVEVWVPQSAVPKGQKRRRSVAPRDILPAPWRKPVNWPNPIKRVAA